MSRKTHGIKILGLAVVAALSMMAFSAVAAQAETYTHAEIKVNGLTMTEAGIPQVEVTGTIGTGQLTVPGLGLIIHCQDGEVKKAVLGPHGTGSAEITFTGCVAKDLNGTTNTKCTIYSDAALEHPGDILAKGSGAVIMGASNGKYYVQATAAAGQPFTTVYMVGERCTLPEENEVTGSAAVAVPNATTESVNHTIEGITTSEEAELGLGLFYGTQEAFIDPGSGSAHLIGAQLGDSWSAQ